MKRSLALFFAIGGVILLACVSYFISAGAPWRALLSGALAILFIGTGFAVKARQRKRN
ncbi:DUF5325 family protein [Gordoniibacillus kamchatkensis]|uniref:DUF5325 family protein n=1 Tax=Gordoniibacillus kamchatkensis TaxID=1590651 RepID=UPI000A6F9A11|nr:DUF5325 family protein [Paenibacillus sp. VKM B-2647]